MKKLALISGKGGTGKTTVASNLSFLASQDEEVVLADCDVDAPNLHLLIQPEVESEETFVGAKTAVKDKKRCTDCGLCFNLCNFGAVSFDYEIDPIKCEGCGLCVAKCPEDALKLIPEETGEVYHSKSRIGPMVHAHLRIGAENSGKLVTKVKDEAEKLVEKESKDLLLIDGSPGIGCPVIASISGVDAVLVVTEPTKSGLSDLKRVLQVVEHFSIPAFIIINKSDLNKNIANRLKRYCRWEEALIIGELPFAEEIVEALQDGELVVERFSESEISQKLENVWKEIKKRV